MSRSHRHHTWLARSFLYSNFSLFCVVKNYDWLDKQQWIFTDGRETFFFFFRRQTIKGAEGARGRGWIRSTFYCVDLLMPTVKAEDYHVFTNVFFIIIIINCAFHRNQHFFLTIEIYRLIKKIK